MKGMKVCISRHVNSHFNVMDKNDLESRMDRIIDWVKTCDTKASIMLTLVGLLVSFVFTSDFVMKGVTSIIRSFSDYHPDSKSICDISITGLLTLVALLFSIYFLLGSIYRLIMVLYSKPKETLCNTNKPFFILGLFNIVFCYKWRDLNDVDTVKDSFIHFNHISNISYQEFFDGMNSETYKDNEDLISQIYINAKRCSEKFSDYNSAIIWMLRSMPCLIIFFLCLILYSA